MWAYVVMLEVVWQDLFGEFDGIVDVEECTGHVPGDECLDISVWVVSNGSSYSLACCTALE